MSDGKYPPRVLPQSDKTSVEFTDSELLDLRRLLLPARMKHHDRPGERKLRKVIEASRRLGPMLHD